MPVRIGIRGWLGSVDETQPVWIPSETSFYNEHESPMNHHGIRMMTTTSVNSRNVREQGNGNGSYQFSVASPAATMPKVVAGRTIV